MMEQQYHEMDSVDDQMNDVHSEVLYIINQVIPFEIEE